MRRRGDVTNGRGDVFIFAAKIYSSWDTPAHNRHNKPYTKDNPTLHLTHHRISTIVHSVPFQYKHGIRHLVNETELAILVDTLRASIWPCLIT